MTIKTEDSYQTTSLTTAINKRLS